MGYFRGNCNQTLSMANIWNSLDSNTLVLRLHISTHSSKPADISHCSNCTTISSFKIYKSEYSNGHNWVQNYCPRSLSLLIYHSFHIHWDWYFLTSLLTAWKFSSCVTKKHSWHSIWLKAPSLFIFKFGRYSRVFFKTVTRKMLVAHKWVISRYFPAITSLLDLPGPL